jgi:hypothetical protein
MTAKKISDEHDLPVELITEWRADTTRRSQRPEEFWIGQQTRIGARVVSQAVLKPRPVWLVAVIAALIFFVVLMTAPYGPVPQKTPAQATIDADQELLLAVEHSLAAGTPAALKPLTLLVEASSNHNESEPISHREHRHEN